MLRVMADVLHGQLGAIAELCAMIYRNSGTHVSWNQSKLSEVYSIMHSDGRQNMPAIRRS